jgi:hypothetical protein
MSRRMIFILCYILFLSISVVPVIYEATLPLPGANQGPWNDRRGFAAFYWYLHAAAINPIVILLSFTSLYPQLGEISNNPGAFSVKGLGVQAVAFLLIGLSWKFRMTTWYGEPL